MCLYVLFWEDIRESVQKQHGVVKQTEGRTSPFITQGVPLIYYFLLMFSPNITNIHFCFNMIVFLGTKIRLSLFLAHVCSEAPENRNRRNGAKIQKNEGACSKSSSGQAAELE